MSHFFFTGMNESAAREVVQWTYPSPYDLYDHHPATHTAVVKELVDPDLGYETVWSGGCLVAFWCQVLTHAFWGATTRMMPSIWGSACAPTSPGMAADGTWWPRCSTG